MTGDRDGMQISVFADSHLCNEEELFAKATLNKLTTRLEALKGNDVYTHSKELTQIEEQTPDSPPSVDDFDSMYPIIGLSSDQNSDMWSEIPACSLQPCTFPPYASSPIVQFCQKKELNKSLGFWMNKKKPMVDPCDSQASLQENLGTNEVLTKPQTPLTPTTVATDSSDAQIDSREESDLASKIPMDIGKHIKKFFQSLPEAQGGRTPTPNKAREASATRSGNMKANKPKRRLSRNRSTHNRQVGKPRASPVAPTPVRVPPSAHRDTRQPQSQQPSQHQQMQYQQMMQQLQSLSLSSSATQRGRATRSRSNMRLTRNAAPGTRASQQLLRRKSPLRQGLSRASTHRLTSRTATSSRYQASVSNIRLSELDKGNIQTSASHRHNLTKTRRTTSSGSHVRSTPSLFGLPRNFKPAESPSKNNVKKKKRNVAKSTSTNRPRSSPSQISRTFPPLDISHSRNAFQQTDNNLTSTSIQANLLPPQVTEFEVDDSKTSSVKKADMVPQGTQTILTSEHKCVSFSVSNNTDNLNLKPLLMSRKVQTNPRVRNTKVATHNFLNGQFTDSDISLYNSQTSVDKFNIKSVKHLVRPGLIKSRISSTTSAVSSLATDSKKFTSRQSSFCRYSHLPRSSFFEIKPRKITNIHAKMSDTHATVGDLKIECLADSETSSENAEKSPDFINIKDKTDDVRGGTNKKETKVVRAPQKRYVTKAKALAEISSKPSNLTSGELDTLATKTSQIQLSSLPTDKECSPEGIMSLPEVCDNSFNRFVNRLRGMQTHFPILRTKVTQNTNKEKLRRDLSKHFLKYGRFSHPALHLAKSKIISSVRVKSNVSVNNTKIRPKKTNVPKSSDASEISSESNSTALVKKNLNMLVEACQNLLSEAMKGSYDSLTSSNNKRKVKSEPTTQETVAWILRTLKKTYGNLEPLNKTSENGFISVIEEECKTCPKIREVSASNELKGNSFEVFSGQGKCQSSANSPVSSRSASSNLEEKKKENATEDNIMESVTNMVEKSIDKNPSLHSNRSLHAVISTSPLKSDITDSNFLHLNCGKYSIALRQLSDGPDKASEEVGMGNISRLVPVNGTLTSLDDSSNVLSKSSINIAPSPSNYCQIINVTPVTKVSMWSKGQEEDTTLAEPETDATNPVLESKSLQNDRMVQTSDSSDISLSVLKELFHEDTSLQARKENLPSVTQTSSTPPSVIRIKL